MGEIGFCQAVPNSVDSGYIVACDSDVSVARANGALFRRRRLFLPSPLTLHLPGPIPLAAQAAGVRLPRGTFSVCQDYPRCENCNSVTRFVDDACIDQASAEQSQGAFGSASAQFQCTRPLLPSALPPPGRALISWFEQPECGELDRTLVDVRLDVCNRVPRGADGGYKVSCAPDGSAGLFSVCSDAACGSCSVNTPFASDQCLANPPQFGSASVAIRCPGSSPSTGLGRAPAFVGAGAPEPSPAAGVAAPSIAGNATTSGGAGATAAGLAAAVAALVAAALAL